MNKDYYVQLNIQDDFDKHIGVVKLNETDSIVLNINLVQNGKPFDLSTASYVTMGVIKPDGNFNNGYCKIVDGPAGKVKYMLPVNCVNQTGVFRGEVQAFNNTSMISTAAFSYEVKNSLLRDEGVTTQPKYPILVELINDVQEAVTSESGRVTAEQGRVTAETGRVSAESARVTAESGRASAETTRVSQENTRTSQESSRVNAESSRVSAENARVTAENARYSAETTRQSNETARVSAETSRANAESARVSAETSRAQAESWRASAETLRVSAENGRVSAESYRVSEFQQILDGWDAIQETDVRAEVVAARSSAKLSTTYSNLDSRLEFIENEVFTSPEIPLTLDPSNQVKSVTDSTDGLIDAEVGGATLNNVVTNGDFANGTAGWSGITATLSKTQNNKLSGTYNGSPNLVIDQAINAKLGDKFFIKARVSVDYPAPYIVIERPVFAVGGGITNPTPGEWYDISFIGDVNLPDIMRIYSTGATTGQSIYIDGNVGVFAVNLTAIGLDSLTVDQCNFMINKYFEGFQGSSDVEIRADGNNLENNKGYITASDGEAIELPNGVKVRSISNGTYRAVSKTYKLKPNTTYRIDATITTIKGFGFIEIRDSNSSIIRSNAGSFTVPSNGIIAVYLFCTAETSGSGEVDFTQIMLSEGASAKPYEAYKGKKLTIKGFTRHKLPNGVQDWFMQKSGYTWAVKNNKEYTIAIGDIENPIDSINVAIVNTNMPSDKKMPSNTLDKCILVENYSQRVNVSSTTLTTDDVGKFIYSEQSGKVVFIMTKGTTLAQAQAELAGRKILYQLATPQYIPFEDFGANGIEVDGIVTTHNDYTHLALTSADVTPTINMAYQGTIQGAVISLKEVSANNLEQVQKHEKTIDDIRSGAVSVGNADTVDNKHIGTAVGDVMAVGTFGFGADALQELTTANSALNLTQTGMWRTSTANALTVGAPIASGGIFVNTVYNASYKSLEFICIVGTVQRRFIKNYNNGTWEAWTEVFHSGNYGNVQKKNASFTLSTSDLDTVIVMYNSTAATITIPPFSTLAARKGATVTVIAKGAGTVTFAPSGATVLNSDGNKRTIDGRYSWATLEHTSITDAGVDDDNVWDAAGKLRV